MDAETPLSVFESAAIVSLRRGDVVLFRCQNKLNAKQRDEVVTMLNDVFRDFESVILDGGQDIAVLRPEPGIVMRCLRTFGRQFTRSDLA